MADFKEALEQGFVAARKADLARKEIDEVFDELKAQILQATENKVLIERRLVHGDSQTVDPLSVLGLSRRPPLIRHWAIVALNPSVDEGTIFELAQWARDKTGYPCTVTWNKQDHICEDKGALINCLSDLLKDPVVGGKLHTLKQLEPTKKG